MYFKVFESYTNFIIIKLYLLINTVYSWIWAQFWKLPYTDMHTNMSIMAVNGSKLKAWVQFLAAPRGNL